MLTRSLHDLRFFSDTDGSFFLAFREVERCCFLSDDEEGANARDRKDIEGDDEG